MSKLNVDQKSIGALFSDIKTDFLIPDYQRPYAWGETECQTLWDDLTTFSFPDGDKNKFDRDNDEYFLGPIVVFKNDEKKMEVIDGQQRLTTIMLILRAFYSYYNNMKDEDSKKMREKLAKCIWKSDELDNPDFDRLKIDSDVVTDEDKKEFISILKMGEVEKRSRSNYAKNFEFFQKCIGQFLNDYPGYFVLLPTRILNNCILLPIEADSQETALRIFSTLNDRGKPLSDSDIFKAQMYKYFNDLGEKSKFIENWKQLESICDKTFSTNIENPLDEIFTKYMYFQRAKQGNKQTTTEALRKFYEKNSYIILKNEATIKDLINLANFWNDVNVQDKNRFSEKVLKKLSILANSPNNMWTNFISVYYLANRKKDDTLDEERFFTFLDISIAFIFTYAITNPGVNSLRTPIYAEMVNIVDGKDITFADYKFDYESLTKTIANFTFNNIKSITRSILTWWTYQNPLQPLIPCENNFDIEHIYARKRNQVEPLKEQKHLESLGNKILLEKRINIRASDYKFCDKKRYYLGYETNNGQKKEGTIVSELTAMAKNQDDFTEDMIENRYQRIVGTYYDYLKQHNLLKNM